MAERSTYRATAHSYAARAKRGRPQVNLSLPIEIVELLDELVTETNGNRTKVVVEALEALAKRKGLR